MIVCAALQLSDKPETVIGCIRHGFGYSTLYDLRPDLAHNKYVIEGFLTDDNRFLDREKAFYHALECGQLSATTRQWKKDKNETELYSEDLY